MIKMKKVILIMVLLTVILSACTNGPSGEARAATGVEQMLGQQVPEECGCFYGQNYIPPEEGGNFNCIVSGNKCIDDPNAEDKCTEFGYECKAR
jgi:hypothetical protein